MKGLPCISSTLKAGPSILNMSTSLSATIKVSGRGSKGNEIAARGVGVDGREIGAVETRSAVGHWTPAGRLIT